MNQDAAYRDVIPTKDGVSVKLEGNAFSEVGSPHYEAHKSMESFWDSYRKGGALEGEMPTNLEYTKALYDSLISSGHTEFEAKLIVDEAIKQRIKYGLLGGEPVPRIPGKINQRK